MDEAAPAEAGAAAEKKRRHLLRRVPTPLIVTLVGIALTAWLLPAFTRQWDDRQKAHEVKAALAGQIATATADELTKNILAARVTDRLRRQAERRHPHDTRKAQGGIPVINNAAERVVGDLWLKHRIALEANLRANFTSTKIVTALHEYNLAMSELGDLASGWAPDVPLLANELSLTSSEKATLRNWIPDVGSETLIDVLAEAFLREENSLIVTVLNGHVVGYSTNTHDLINDLIP